MQNTVKKSLTITGIGVHSGKTATICIKPASEDHGIKFFRTDINSFIDCTYENVVQSQLCTMLQTADCQVSTIEHLVSAFFALQIDNALVEIDNEEVPILDGSAIIFYQKLKENGVAAQNRPRKYVKVKKMVEVIDNDKFLRITPDDKLILDVTVDFNHPLIGRQSRLFTEGDDYAKEIAPARTFGYEHELEYLRSIGKGQGVSVENAIGFTRDGLADGSVLRFEDEPVRHKMLDLIGDLYLGGHIIGKVEGYKMGHHLNNALLHKLYSDTSNYEIISADEYKNVL